MQFASNSRIAVRFTSHLTWKDRDSVRAQVVAEVRAWVVVAGAPGAARPAWVRGDRRVPRWAGPASRACVRAAWAPARFGREQERGRARRWRGRSCGPARTREGAQARWPARARAQAQRPAWPRRRAG